MGIGTETPLRWGKQDVFFLWEKNQSVAKTTLCILSLRRISEQPLGGCSLCRFCDNLSVFWKENRAWNLLGSEDCLSLQKVGKMGKKCIDNICPPMAQMHRI